MSVAPLIPFEDDYPTGPIEDIWPLLAEGHVVDANGAVHGRDGKFVPKIVPPAATVRRFHPDVSESVVASCCPECVYESAEYKEMSRGR